MGAMVSLHSFKVRVWMLSGPAALCGLRLLSNLVIPFCVTCMSGIFGCGLGPLSGIGVSDMGVKAVWNCLLSMLDFETASDCKRPFSLSGGMFVVSVFCVLIYENRFLGIYKTRLGLPSVKKR